MNERVKAGQTWQTPHGNTYTVQSVDGEWAFCLWHTSATAGNVLRLHLSQILRTGDKLIG